MNSPLLLRFIQIFSQLIGINFNVPKLPKSFQKCLTLGSLFQGRIELCIEIKNL